MGLPTGFFLQVSVSDNGDPVLQSSSRVVIQVLDVNDNPPSFSQKLFMVQLPEKAASETPLPVYRVIAADRDEGLNCQITYSLEENSEGLFSIHPVTGIVFSQKAFSAQEYNILTVSIIRSTRRQKTGDRLSEYGNDMK